MRAIEREVARRVKAMTRNEVMMRAIAGKLTWIEAGAICGIQARQMRWGGGWSRGEAAAHADRGQDAGGTVPVEARALRRLFGAAFLGAGQREAQACGVVHVDVEGAASGGVSAEERGPRTVSAQAGAAAAGGDAGALGCLDA